MAIATPETEHEQEVHTLDPAIMALLPRQGEWSERDYLWLAENTNQLVEWTDGVIEVLPMPTSKHQEIAAYLYDMLRALMQRIGGKVLFAPLRMRVGPRKFREPDLLLVCQKDDPRRSSRYWEGADMVVEVVSPDDPSRDYETKRADYAGAGMLEYWIVDPHVAKITVLRLDESVYVEHGVFGRGAKATSALFADFELSVDAVLDAA